MTLNQRLIAILLAVVLRVAIAYLGVPPAAIPYLMWGFFVLACLVPFTLNWAPSIKQNWAEKKQQFYKLVAERWGQQGWAIFGSIVSFEIITVLLVAHSARGAAAFGTTQLWVSLATVNAMLLFIWLTTSRADITGKRPQLN